MCETMVTGVQDNQQPDDLEAGEGVYVTLIYCTFIFFLKLIPGDPSYESCEVCEHSGAK